MRFGEGPKGQYSAGLTCFIAAALLLAFVSLNVSAQPACKGPNKNDPGCGAEVVVAPAVVESVTVDWAGEKLVVRGSDLTNSTQVLIGGNPTPLPVANVDVSGVQLDVPFNADMAAEVSAAGSYNLTVDGTVQLSVYIESEVIDPLATGCPCAADWGAALGSLYTDKVTECIEIEGPLANDAADISGTILTDASDSAVYPHYPIGASFYPGEPDSSFCRLAQVNGDATVSDLVNLRINETQQQDCAAELALQVCSSIITLP